MQFATKRRMMRCVVSVAALLCALTMGAWAQNGSSQPSTAATPPNTTGSESTVQPAIAPVPSEPPRPFTGSYQATGNFSLLGKPRPSLGHRLNLSYAPKFGGSFDSRLEYYVEGSYNADPPGILGNNINEPKFEAQLMYNRPLNKRLSVTGGLLYHDNFRFPDRYFWAITGLTLSVPIGQQVTFSSAALIEQKLGGVRPFYDLSGTLEYRFAPKWNTQLSFHRYENVGQFDPQPTQKAEYELGLNRALTAKDAVGISYFCHIQFNAPNDQFTFLKLKYSRAF